MEGDALDKLKEIDDYSIDLIVTDPPYGYSFMGKEWDKAVVSVEVWRECLRVMKAGAFAFVMSAPRQDVLSRMIVNLQDAGFRTDFTSIYWTYASGFPKAANVSKLADKRKNRNPETDKSIADYLKQQRIKKGLTITHMNKFFNSVATYTHYETINNNNNRIPTKQHYEKLKQILDLDDRFDELIEREEAKREIIGYHNPHLDGGKRKKYKVGGYGGQFHELKTINGEIPLTASATEAAKKLDGSYCGFQPKPAVEVVLTVMKPLSEKSFVDQALNNGKGITWLDDCRIPFQNGDGWNRSTTHKQDIRGNKWNSATETYELPPQEANEKGRFPANLLCSDDALNGHSKYFDLDVWYSSQAQFIITPKASPSERQGSTHPTMKPIKLMSYLITLGSRENDIVLDPFCGSGTTLIAAHLLNRRWMGIELNTEYAAIARKRIEPYLIQQKLL